MTNIQQYFALLLGVFPLLNGKSLKRFKDSNCELEVGVPIHRATQLALCCGKTDEEQKYKSC